MINKNEDVYYHFEIIVYYSFMELECSAFRISQTYGLLINDA